MICRGLRPRTYASGATLDASVVCTNDFSSAVSVSAILSGYDSSGSGFVGPGFSSKRPCPPCRCRKSREHDRGVAGPLRQVVSQCYRDRRRFIMSTASRAADPPDTPAPAAGSETSAVELRRFQPGLWEYRRTLVSGNSAKPQVSTVRKCADPSADIRKKIADLRKRNCQFTPLRRKQDHYLSSWICQTPKGAMRFHDVLKASDESSSEKRTM